MKGQLAETKLLHLKLFKRCKGRTASWEVSAYTQHSAFSTCPTCNSTVLLLTSAPPAICLKHNTSPSAKKVYTYKQNALTRQKVQPMHVSSVRSVEDMSALDDLHDGAIMYNLYLRYQQRLIYVSLTHSAHTHAAGLRLSDK
ncbi:hypothetical protein WMY93_001093 [Mugilogobius chulae]|uniref:Uncharacterized protein n=1 Tax=Mugilogobius chulae TaxID=88201 RepID=A0AAW0QB73_9GOBI